MMEDRCNILLNLDSRWVLDSTREERCSTLIRRSTIGDRRILVRVGTVRNWRTPARGKAFWPRFSFFLHFLQ